ncbi:MAG: hypothetical protein SX243_12205 [Acidobacteriota bacterium]|nr:hypothetical protein [Acidobacteriota bacterium]
MLLRSAQGERFAMLEVRVPEALGLEPQAFEDACKAGYLAIFHQLQQMRHRHPVRLWNFIPRILAPLGDQPHRYMHFNFGRYHAYLEHFGHERFIQAIATASGVGHDQEDLSLVCLSTDHPGTPVENPRQVASYRYSERWGTLPPCFARATRLPHIEGSEPLLLVGGTASVRGEDSVHLQDLVAQVQETLTNLAAVVQAGEDPDRRPIEGPADGPAEETADHRVDELLARYRHLRVYYVEGRHLETLQELLGQRLSPDTEVEYLPADLCRPELLVEIEGLAELQRSPAEGRGEGSP